MYLIDQLENARQQLALIEALLCQSQDVVEINQEACRGLVSVLSDARRVMLSVCEASITWRRAETLARDQAADE